MADNYIVAYHGNSVWVFEIVFFPYILKFLSNSCIPLISIDMVASNTPAQLIQGHTPTGYNDLHAKRDAPNFIIVIICCCKVMKLITMKFISGGKFSNSQNLAPLKYSHYTVPCIIPADYMQSLFVHVFTKEREGDKNDYSNSPVKVMQ